MIIAELPSEYNVVVKLAPALAATRSIRYTNIKEILFLDIPSKYEDIAALICLQYYSVILFFKLFIFPLEIGFYQIICKANLRKIFIRSDFSFDLLCSFSCQ